MTQPYDDTLREQFREVQRILNEATDRGEEPGRPVHDGKGRFWNVPLEEFLKVRIYPQTPDEPPVVIPGYPKKSLLLKALKGEPPFDGSTALTRMPRARPPVEPEDIAFIENWINALKPRDEG